MLKQILTTVTVVCLLFCTLLVAEDKGKSSKEKNKDKKDELTLEKLFLDPTGGHGLGGDVKNLSRYRKYEEFLLRTVGS